MLFHYHIGLYLLHNELSLLEPQGARVQMLRVLQPAFPPRGQLLRETQRLLGAYSKISGSPLRTLPTRLCPLCEQVLERSGDAAEERRVVVEASGPRSRWKQRRQNGSLANKISSKISSSSKHRTAGSVASFKTQGDSKISRNNNNCQHIRGIAR